MSPPHRDQFFLKNEAFDRREGIGRSGQGHAFDGDEIVARAARGDVFAVLDAAADQRREVGGRGILRAARVREIGQPDQVLETERYLFAEGPLELVPGPHGARLGRSGPNLFARSLVAALEHHELDRFGKVEIDVDGAGPVVALAGVFEAAHGGIVPEVFLGEAFPAQSAHRGLVEIEQKGGTLRSGHQLADAGEEGVWRAVVDAHVGFGFEQVHLFDDIEAEVREVIGQVLAVGSATRKRD